MPVVLDAGMLNTVPLFHGLTSTQGTHLQTFLHQKTFPAGYTLMTAEQPGDVAYIILRGTVKVHVEHANGSAVILALLGAGQVVGELSVIEHEMRSASVVTLEASTLLWMERGAWQHGLASMPVLARNLIRLLARRLRVANAQIQALATQDVFGRVARQRVAFAEEYGQPSANGATLIPLRLTQSDLASLVGASRVRVNQVLSVYHHRRLIGVHPNHPMTVVNVQALAQRGA